MHSLSQARPLGGLHRASPVPFRGSSFTSGVHPPDATPQRLTAYWYRQWGFPPIPSPRFVAHPHVSHLRRPWETGFPLAIVAREGLEETLSALHALGMRLGIVTNGEVRFQAPRITQLSIGQYLSTVVISEAMRVQKPDPRIFAHGPPGASDRKFAVSSNACLFKRLTA
jgi:Haloacid dehalogenase-like hydrolase